MTNFSRLLFLCGAILLLNPALLIANQPVAECIPLQGMQVTNSELFPHTEQESLSGQYQGQCISAGLLDDLVIRVTDYLQAQGFITSRAYLEPQDISDGNLLVSVLPGRVGSVGPAENPVPQRRIDGLLPESGDLLNLRQLENAVSIIERVPSARASFSLRPGNEAGVSDIQYTIEDLAQWQLQAGILARNDADADLIANLRFDNPLDLNDMLWLRLNNGRIVTDNASSEGYEVDYSIPFGSSLVTLSAEDFSYRQAVQGQFGSYQSSGDTRGWQLSWIDRHRGVEGNHWRYGLLASAETTRSFFENEPLDVASYDSRELGLILGYEMALLATGELTLDYRYLRGVGDTDDAYFNSLEGFGSLADPEGLRQRMEANLVLPSRDRDEWFNLAMTLQVSSDRLRQNRQLTLGSFGTVRGYQAALKGSEGWFANSNYYWQWFDQQGKRIIANVGVDYGKVSCDVDNPDLCGSIYGLGAGWSLADANFSAQFLLGLPLRDLPQADADEEQLFLTLMWTL